MSDQAYTERVHVAAKKRREYLLKKGMVTLFVWLGALFVVCSCLIGLGALLTIRDDPDCGLDGYPPCHSTSERALAGVRLVTVSIFVGFAGRFMFRKQKLKAEAMSYVPPVHEQMAGRDADDLLRGSSQSTAPHIELLRAAYDGPNTKDELLRPTEIKMR